MSLPSTKYWVIKAIALTILIPVPVALMAFAVVYLLGMNQRGVVPENTAFLVFLVVPPLWLMALVLLGRAEMDIGAGEEPKGELETLLKKKHLGLLRDQPRQVTSWPEHQVTPAPPAPKAAPAESGPVLDQLLAWQRRHRRKRPR
jgi:hypothetical protein